MGFYYFDASALVKYYIVEPGTTWIRQVVNVSSSETMSRANIVLIGGASIVEGPAAFAVLYRTNRISRGARDKAFTDFNIHIASQRWTVIPVTAADFTEAARLTQRYPLKAYDATQLAVALRQRQELSNLGLTMTFVSGDKTLLTAARAEGLTTDNPFDHIAPEDTPQS